jgi:hypothetical protein
LRCSTGESNKVCVAVIGIGLALVYVNAPGFETDRERAEICTAKSTGRQWDFAAFTPPDRTVR